MTDVNELVNQCIRLKGDDPANIDQYYYDPQAVCVHCKLIIRPEGQSALSAVATARGVFFRMGKPCPCGRKLGLMEITHD